MTMLIKPTKRGPKQPKRLPRKKMARRQSRNPLPKLKRKFWDLLAAYIKERDGDGCWACGAKGLVGSNNHASHLFNAGNHSAIRYHPDNLHPTCGRCNVWLRGNIAPYAATFIERLGLEKYQCLNRHARDEKKWSRPEIETLIAALERGGAEYELRYEEKHGLS